MEKQAVLCICKPGRVIKTELLLEYTGDEELRRIVQATKNKCEGFEGSGNGVDFGGEK
ncbi:Tn3 family transposase [Erwinia sp. HDF1-3R]|uniref:Tn3 family transposase n=1 Tax=Erwinia sp. HDF1-3R TaxID=3141543 RepID=UPI0031F4EFE1